MVPRRIFCEWFSAYGSRGHPRGIADNDMPFFNKYIFYDYCKYVGVCFLPNLRMSPFWGCDLICGQWVVGREESRRKWVAEKM